MKKLNWISFAALLIFAGLSFTACDKDDDNEGELRTNNILITANITENTTWTKNNVYELGGRITIEAGSTLTIEPGTIIKGQAGTGSNATALLVARDATLTAIGSASAPIIFTSVADEINVSDITAGNFASPNLDPNISGLWGGVIVLGNAKISASNDSDSDISEVQIEGIPTSDPNGLYGGDDNEDSSGTLKYISIRHGGTNIGSGNEINGLTLGGVGSNTVIENIEIVANQDDGIEFFGGAVNVKNLVSWNVGDDGIDTDQSWSGMLDNFIVITPDGHCFELDGPEGSMKASHIIKNGLVISSEDSGDLINVDENSLVALSNIAFKDVQEGQQINRVTAAGVSFTNIELMVAENKLASHVNGAVPNGVSAVNTPTVGATTSVFSWTWAAAAAKF